MPSSVSVTDTIGINTSHQRKSFYARGLHWVFYGRPGIYYRVSPDGLAWSDPVFVCPSSYADFFSLYFDGTYLHYTYYSGRAVGGVPGGEYKLWYRKGLPNANGTITWITEEQLVPEIAAGLIYACDATICVDSYGCPWIGYYHAEDGWRPGVVKSQRSDGIWETAPGFPYILSNRSYRAVGVTPLTAGKVYALYYRAWKKAQGGPGAYPQPIYGKLWNGAEWGLEERVSSSNVNQEEFHMVSFLSVGDDVHCVFLKDVTNEIVHVRRTSGGWGPETVVAQASNLSSPVISYSPSTGTIYCFWAENNRVYYKKYIGGIWDTIPTEWVYEDRPIDSYSRLYPSKIISDLEMIGGRLGVAWLLYADTASALLRYNHLRG